MFELVGGLRGAPAVMGIVNVTPDSFSDGGRFLDPDAAVAHGLALVEPGPTCSTSAASPPDRARPVDDGEELRAVLPVVERLAARAGVPVSIDTTQGGGCRAALDAGAHRRERRLRRAPTRDARGRRAPRAGSSRCTCRASRARCRTPALRRRRREVGDFLADASTRRDGRHRPTRVCADPGIGFGKTAAHNLELLARLDELVARVSTCPCSSARRASVPRARASATTAARATTARSPPWCGRRPGRASCACTTSAHGATRRACYA
jgi:dihydropteroate synthase